MKRETPLAELSAGMHVAIDAYWRTGWVYYPDHRVVSVHRYNHGGLHAFVIEPWKGGERIVVAAKDVLTAWVHQEPPVRMRSN